VPDRIFTDPRLAEIYDLLDGDRHDLDLYVALVEEVGAQSVLDIGCGTGTFACLLAGRGVEVIGVDPAAASLQVARRKAGADAVKWVVGDAAALPALGVDAVTMTGNVAQVFTTDAAWGSTLRAARSSLRAGGSLLFEARDPARRAWQAWTRDSTFRRVDLPGAGQLETWVELTEVALPLVSFRWTFVFTCDGLTLTSDSTLRFRTRSELIETLEQTGFVVMDVRDAPDRPGLEFIFIAKTTEQ
jgi:ubiquinone/menaquinone biosynthesis C-methylase UbiE